MKLIGNSIVRHFIFALGVFSLGLGVIGIFLPLLPTTCFVLLSAWCFMRSSERAHHWIYDHPFLGNILKSWEQSRSIPLGAKVLALAMISFSLTLIWWKGPTLWVQLPVTFLLASISLFIITRKTA